MRSGTGSTRRARKILHRLLPEASAKDLGKLSSREVAELDAFLDEEDASGQLIQLGPKPIPRPRPIGRMRVNLVINGGSQAFMDVMEGLVRRNVRTIREGKIPALAQSNVKHVETPIWRDAIGAVVHGSANAGTLAAWAAAERRVHQGDRTARIGLVQGVPMVISGEDQVGGLSAIPVVPRGASVRGLVGATRNPNRGRIKTQLYVTLDDDTAQAVRDMGDAIARHNAKQIRTEGLPCLYKSGVRYKTEGSPEKWWDAKEILRHGHDDCEGLAAYRAGELILEGIDAKVWTRLIPKPGTGGPGLPGQKKTGRLFHALVRVDTPTGPQYDDPSARLGMPVPGWYSEYLTKQRRLGLPV